MNPHTELDPEYAIVENMLDKGIYSEDISTLVTGTRRKLAFELLYLFADPTDEFPGELGEALDIGIYMRDEDEEPIAESGDAFSGLHELLYEARPDLDLD